MKKLETRIATLKQANRIIWIEGISAEVIKGKVAGKPVFFVKADSLNANGGNWYYIVRWESVEWVCTCESVQPCKHCRAVGIRVNAQFRSTDDLIAEKKSIVESWGMYIRGTLPLTPEQAAQLDARGWAVSAEVAKRLKVVEDEKAYEKRLAYVQAFDPCLVV